MPGPAPAPPPLPLWSREALRAGLNDRLLMVRRLERLGLRRCLLACGIYLACKVLSGRTLGVLTGLSVGAGAAAGAVRAESKPAR